MQMNVMRALLCAVIMVVATGSPLFAAVQLTPVATGLTSPIFVGHAGDGSGRLFIVEQAGRILVLQPGSSTPTVFLNINAISPKVLSGGERGLLGLAFDPQYPTTRRFFVFYTRTGDGAIVIAEYRASETNRDVASQTETVLLTIPHPTNSNHNGGMLAFGQDGYLYIGVGDGGGSNDPANNAQNKNRLLGKILRIDINPPAGSGLSYVSPVTNPFVNDPDALDEIYAYGMRNPWRFSFDRLTGEQWVADVGQGAREEVDSPIVSRGNYGWRVYEGTPCTTNDPALCNNLPDYEPPLFDYAHVNNRCSITGGYVYRGMQNVFPSGTYVYGDYCTGEIFTWDGTAQAVLFDTAFNISSFGEDEAGELYVVNLGGSISRFINTTPPPCSYSLNPTSQNAGSSGGTGFTVSVTAGGGCGWTASSNASWLQITGGSSGTSNGTVTYSVAANTSASSRQGTMTIAGQTFTVNQSGAPASCSFSISPKNVNVPRQGSTGSVAVTAPAGCNWTAVSNNTWIIVTGGASGSGNGSVTYSVQSSTGRRNGSITIAGRNFQVKQR